MSAFPVPYIIGTATQDVVDVLGCDPGDSYAVFPRGKEARSFVCDLHLGKPMGLDVELRSALDGLLNDFIKATEKEGPIDCKKYPNYQAALLAYARSKTPDPPVS